MNRGYYEEELAKRDAQIKRLAEQHEAAQRELDSRSAAWTELHDRAVTEGRQTMARLQHTVNVLVGALGKKKAAPLLKKAAQVDLADQEDALMGQVLGLGTLTEEEAEDDESGGE